MIFYLGTHEVSWLATIGVPLFVSHRRLALRRALPRAVAPWALDSGGFSELSLFGEWRTSPSEYAAAVKHYQEAIGSLTWCAPQDWMCEPEILRRTGLTIAEHQRRTVASVCELRAAGLPVIPVLQGWSEGDYWDCAEAYERAGITLTNEPVVGLGTICRRQQTLRAVHIVRGLHDAGLRLHGFGFKVTGLRACGEYLASADSLAWSFHARREGKQRECTHATCVNCARFALEWRSDLLGSLAA